MKCKSDEYILSEEETFCPTSDLLPREQEIVEGDPGRLVDNPK